MAEPSAEAALTVALRYEEQAKREIDPALIGHCLGERDWWLAEAARLEDASKEQGNG